MVMANEVASRLGLMKTDEAMRIKKLLLKYSLPVTYSITNVHSFYEAFFLDKKSLDANITFIIPEHIGGVELRDDIAKDIIIDVLTTFTETSGV
jgi:3-dehydroquinate synthase